MIPEAYIVEIFTNSYSFYAIDISIRKVFIFDIIPHGTFLVPRKHHLEIFDASRIIFVIIQNEELDAKESKL